MAAIRNEFSFLGVHVSFGKPKAVGESRRAREFANKVYKETKGATPELKRMYAKLLENERRTSGS
ncbi:hypothetical protein [Brevundimonas sp. Leaf363]|uniref:hypothetical protein n=1 Tax=Brevundimonas sp. Leaf363 TaxID=1736353 RepID=UPI000A6F6B4C|nr:hypothetical protein [Brevundimonas sp. Leaf363]